MLEFSPVVQDPLSYQICCKSNLLSCYILRLSGLVADKTNSYHAAFFFAGGIEFLGVFIFVVCSCLKRRDLSREQIEIDMESYSFSNLLSVERETVL